ncbi:hypothetical protein [Methylosinus sp. LW3]|uniref:hypothetical protein n=1 Tax=Methylosinus sp. LW3 TaxID=107635 RepID=UPI00046544B0|nr:hypothetical protein [Methylosinus sp. LW3]
MMQPANNSGEEKEILSSRDADERARQWRGTKDPFADDIPPSLLSADHIEKYVLATGMIAPFYKGGEKPRLKKASYEGRIGSKAYIFEETDNPVSIFFDATNPLCVRANSIVFVETDLEFRLPDYIAIRFNLQIRHVHRGLLLGTGPLVDPGYWGKLCIPLHNLTNEDYLIPIEEGLIWVEFTKTTSTPTEGSDPLLRDGREHWDIEKFIRKAALPFAGGNRVGIRSSIPIIAVDASKAAENARAASQTAASDAKEAQRAAEDLKNRLQTIGWLAVAGLGIALIALYLTIFFGWRADMSAVWGKIADSASSMGELKSSVGDNGKTIEEMTNRLKALEAEIETLRRQTSATDVRLPVAARPETKPHLQSDGKK